MNLYLDDDITKVALATRLRKAGHVIVLPSKVGMSAGRQTQSIYCMAQSSLVILTKNHDDYKNLHLLVLGTGGFHAGVMVVRWDNDPSRNMKDQDIVRAIGKLQAAGVPVANEFHILNHWR